MYAENLECYVPGWLICTNDVCISWQNLSFGMTNVALWKVFVRTNNGEPAVDRGKRSTADICDSSIWNIKFPAVLNTIVIRY